MTRAPPRVLGARGSLSLSAEAQRLSGADVAQTDRPRLEFDGPLARAPSQREGAGGGSRFAGKSVTQGAKRKTASRVGLALAESCGVGGERRHGRVKLRDKPDVNAAPLSLQTQQPLP